MAKKIALIVIFICMEAVMSGCATMRYPGTYKVAGIEARKFEELDDEKALKLVVLIYNVKQETWEGNIARSLALQEYMGLLGRRKSKYLKDSGVFQLAYDKADLKSWKDDDLIKLYDGLEPKAHTYYMDSAAELTEMQNAERIIYLTAESAIVTEMKKRSNTRNVITVAGQVLMTVLTVALSML